MARNIAVANDVYEMLSKEKKKGESFSDVIRRLQRSRGSLMDCYGLWGDMPEKEFQRVRKAIESLDRPLSEELKRRGVKA